MGTGGGARSSRRGSFDGGSVSLSGSASRPQSRERDQEPPAKRKSGAAAKTSIVVHGGGAAVGGAEQSERPTSSKGGQTGLMKQDNAPVSEVTLQDLWMCLEGCEDDQEIQDKDKEQQAGDPQV